MNTPNGSNKQVAYWRHFRDTGLPGGTAANMAVGDSFKITVSATQAYGSIGVALLSSPSATASWGDRHSNYAVQVNLDGNGVGTQYPWTVISTGGATDASSFYGADNAYSDFKILFTLTTTTTMTVEIQKNVETAQSFDVTLNNSDISGYSIYLSDDYNGNNNANIYWKPTTEYIVPSTISTNAVSITDANVYYADHKLHIKGDAIKNYSLEIFNLQGASVKQFDNESKTEIPLNLRSGIYISKIQLKDSEIVRTQKIIVH
jgi:hypothetical protein